MFPFGWIKRLKRGDSFGAVRADDWNKIANVLETIEGEGGIAIVKTENGLHWRITAGDEGPMGGVSIGSDARCVADWRYVQPSGSSANGYVEVCYGTLAIVDGVLSVVPDRDGNGDPIWRRQTGSNGPCGGGGTQVVQESY